MVLKLFGGGGRMAFHEGRWESLEVEVGRLGGYLDRHIRLSLVI